MTWNFDMSEAPRGETVTRKQRGKHGEMDVSVFVPDLIIAASECGKVTLSRWLPDQDRWNMFTKDSPPIAWQPWPEHPKSEGQS